LDIAAYQGTVSAVTDLVNRGTEVNDASGWSGLTPLMWAAAAGHFDAVQYLVARGHASVNARSETGMTALLLAAANGHRAVVRYLVQSKAAVTAQSTDGVTALMLGAEYGHRDIVQDLLADGGVPSVNVRSQNGKTALMMAAAGRTPDAPAIVHLLLSKGASVTLRDAQGSTALDNMALDTEEISPTIATSIVAYLVQQGTDVNASNLDGETPLIRAAMYGRYDVARVLMKSRVDVNTRDRRGETARDYACRGRLGDIVSIGTPMLPELLLANGGTR
jgi:ankyrin repeat protein